MSYYTNQERLRNGLSYPLIALSDYANEATSDPDGKVSRGQAKFGDVRWAEPVTHEARNTGTTEQRVIRIELKKDWPPSDSHAGLGASDELDSLLACKETQKLIFENQFVKAIDDRIQAMEKGYGEDDICGSIRVLEDLAGCQVTASAQKRVQ